MRLLSWLALAGSIVFAVGCAVSAATPAAKPIPQMPTLEERKTAYLGDYKGWKVANEKLYQVQPAVWILCRPPTPEESAVVNDQTHAGYIKVFVSPEGEEAMFSRKPFPYGTTIVKERHPTLTSGPEFCTIMRKRETGYNPKCGDWEFSIADPKGKIVEDGQLEKCMSCHQAKKNLDYTFRTYLGQPKGDPFDVWQVLQSQPSGELHKRLPDGTHRGDSLTFKLLGG